MVAAAGKRDVDAFVAADLAFHQIVLDAAGNAFISALLQQLSRLLVPARRQTSEVEDIRRHAIEHHRLVLDAVRSGDPERARHAMHQHIDQTSRDLRRYVLEAGTDAPKAPSVLGDRPGRGNCIPKLRAGGYARARHRGSGQRNRSSPVPPL